MTQAISPYTVEERVVDGDTTWVAIRARGAEWSWLTPSEAARLGRLWLSRYGHVLHDEAPEAAALLVAAE